MTWVIAGNTSSPLPSLVPPTRPWLIRATSPARTRRRRKIAAASPVSMRNSKPSPIRTTRITMTPRTGSAITILTASTNSPSKTGSPASQTVAAQRRPQPSRGDQLTLTLVNSGNTLLGNSGGPSPSTSLGNAQQERSTLTVAVGRGYGVAGARFTLDAANIESQSVAQSTQIRSFGDVQYRFTPVFAAVGRVGFEDLRYPRGRLAFNEPIFQIGGQMTTAIGGAVLRFGRQDGFYGFDGALRFQITPALAVLASHQHSLGSSTESVLTNLNNSSLDPYGTMVDSTTALPLGLANPEFAATTDLFRNQQSRVALELDAGRTDSFRLFAFLDHRVSLAGLSSSDTGKGASFSWFRSLTPDLTSTVALGYATHVSGGGTKTATLDLALTYTMTETLSGAVRYELIESGSHISANSFLTNVLGVTLRKSF